jgi:hypothetical protein
MHKQTILIKDCLKLGGCQMKDRCATLPYLRLVGYDREWRGVTPSAAGTGPRLLYLKATTDYVIDPNDRSFAAIGTGTHAKLSLHQYTHDVLSEEELSDGKIKGIADVLEIDENSPKMDLYILNDYKTFGSYKAARVMGIISVDRPLLDEKGKPVLLKSGKNKGKPKTRKVVEYRPERKENREVALQLNRYRILFERYNFPVSKINIQINPRDGNTYMAKNRGIDRNLYMEPIPILPDQEILDFYDKLQAEVDEAFKTGWIRQCNAWESWNGRRCKGYCEIAAACVEMDASQQRKAA